MDVNGCPADVEEFARNYFGMIRSIVARYRGVDPQDVDDLAQIIVMKFIQNDYLHKYDPEAVFQTPSGPRHARFAPLVRSFVKKFMRGVLETYRTQEHRDVPPTRLEQPTLGGDLWVEVYAPAEVEAGFGAVEVALELERALEHLGTFVVGEQSHELLTLADVARAMVTEADGKGKVARRRVAKRLGVADQTITVWSRWIRDELESIGFPNGGYFGEMA